ncbi:inositol hexakisphosphate and diphosphoinositol-pentakisphosphate kinase-like isoform X2 [Daphnia pulicaria]|uniref:inositol hexakisphosphate and diphosphoinositol-pentakisphosphate kinase-like isoform X2 n=1 Tax=Daphnia pulicaria TaxID=35523 RepID=UPI001EEB5219|nr:inositol hexakisphosphate and diphosphoinositol-pentakisphosphate kinase-like isoform X2 [Daphnia pulicaria]
MSYKELEVGYQGLKAASFYIGDESEGASATLANEAGLASDTLPTTYEYVYTSASSPTRTFHPNCPICLQKGEECQECPDDLFGSDLDPLLGRMEKEYVDTGKQVVAGICAMAKKSNSKPMREILARLDEFDYIKTIIFPEETILKEPVDKWPVCDCLISFHSKGFPLDKAVAYAELVRPYTINNLRKQFDLQDRRKVYGILRRAGIALPRFAILDRDSPDPSQHSLIESEDHVEVNGIVFNKPFVEKPVSAEDHNIYIYYPTSAGGGSQRLFRKIGSRSSVYSPESKVRKNGSYIYEDFIPTDGADVKVYTVGPDYAHAEARKSPALDGKVERDHEGKEIRYPVILSNLEKLIARKVCLAFNQTVCGFDLLRANGRSFVCDVNGFSFVKNSAKYYDDCARILGNMILRRLAPTLHIPWALPFQLDDPPIVPTTFGKMMELRCVVAVIRHGDRTPKQKMKMEVRHPRFFALWSSYESEVNGRHLKLKKPAQLQEVLDIARFLLSEVEAGSADRELEEKRGKLEQLKTVLEMYGHFSGINRKVQLKYQPRGRPQSGCSEEDTHNEPSLLLILKWGGELTPAGRVQAEELGRIFRCMYPGGNQGLGLLRLHSTYRHDLKIYASDEGRVQMTAAAFAKGLLALEGELTPILFQMVKSANTNGLLDNDGEASSLQHMVKSRLQELLQMDRELTENEHREINPCGARSIEAALHVIGNPVQCCVKVYELVCKLVEIVRSKRDDPKTKNGMLYHGETWELMARRWGKLEKDFKLSENPFEFDISKIPDIYDCIKYDIQHNQAALKFNHAQELYMLVKALADVVIPQEYGLSDQDKLAIGQGICNPLMRKIRADLQRNIEEDLPMSDESVNRLDPRYSHGVSSPGRHVRTRLYFTSESHLHSLLTVLRFGGLVEGGEGADEQWRRAMEYVSQISELNYMSQVVIMLYEDQTKDPTSEQRFHVELHFSPGVNCCVQKNLPPGPGFRTHHRNSSPTETSPNKSCPTSIPPGSNSVCSPNCTRIEEEDLDIADVVDHSEQPKHSFLNLSVPVRTSRTSSGSESPSITPPNTLKIPIITSEPIPIRNSPGRNPLDSPHLSFPPTSNSSPSLMDVPGGLIMNSSNSSCASQHTPPRSYRVSKSPDFEPQGPRAKAHTISGVGVAAPTRSLDLDEDSDLRRHRHSIPGHLNVLMTQRQSVVAKRKLSQHQHQHPALFSTAVISGSSSAPELTAILPSTGTAMGLGLANLAAIDPCVSVGVPAIRPLETLHNGLSLKQLDQFLEQMTTLQPLCSPLPGVVTSNPFKDL